VEPVGPEMRPAFRLDELRGDAQSGARLAHAPFQNVAHAQLAPHLPHVHGPVMMSSTMPSAKYSCSGSPLIFWKASTAIEGLSGSVRRAGAGATIGEVGLASEGTPTWSE